MFEMVPQTQMDRYMSKLASGSIKTKVTQCVEARVDEAIQTGDDTRQRDKHNQAPEDQMYSYNKDKKQAVVHEETRVKGKMNKAELTAQINLKKFLSNAAPVMEKVICLNLEEKAVHYYKLNKEDAAGRNAVELRLNLRLPEEVLYLFGEQQEDGSCVPATIEKISCMHMFESCPHSTVALAYVLEQVNGDKVHLCVVASMWQMQLTSILLCSDEITQICTSGTSAIVVLGTVLGSFFIYELLNLDTVMSTANTMFNYEALLAKVMQKQGKELE